MQFYKNNILLSPAEIKSVVDEERPLNNHHEGTIIHSSAFKLNAHAKYKILRANVVHRLENDTLRIFVPNNCSVDSLVNILSAYDTETKIELDIRSYVNEGKAIIELFKPFLRQCIFDVEYNNNIEQMIAADKFDVELKGKVFKKLYLYLQPPYIFDKEREADIIRGRFSTGNVVVIVDKKTLHEADIYSAVVLTYFSKYFTIKGELPVTYNKIFRTMNFDGIKFRISIAGLSAVHTP